MPGQAASASPDKASVSQQMQLSPDGSSMIAVFFSGYSARLGG